LTLKSIDDIERSHSLSLGVLGIGNSIMDHRLEKGLETASGFLIDQSRNTLDTSSASQSTDGGLGNAFGTS
jgi:hypothetical protein